MPDDQNSTDSGPPTTSTAEAATADPETAELVERVPEGWTPVVFDGRRYGMTRTNRANGRSISILAEELGGSDLVSANVYQVHNAVELRPCEMPAAKVLDFLRGWTRAT